MAPSEQRDKPSRAGITVSSTGERHIPSSTRADGSVRKEIRVRPGYRPPEDVEVYKNKTAEGFNAARKFRGVPGAELVEPQKVKSDIKKAPKKKEAAQANGTIEKPKIQEELQQPEPVEPVDPEAEKEKEARKLCKKLRQARELLGKKEKGDALLPEQFQKVIKINELIRQLDVLGFDEEGQKKDP